MGGKHLHRPVCFRPATDEDREWLEAACEAEDVNINRKMAELLTAARQAAQAQEGTPAMTMNGPFETSAQARDAVLPVIGALPPGRGLWQIAQLSLLRNAARSAGAELGAYDERVLSWLAGWEPETCAVIAGLITRAGQGRAREGTPS